MAMEGERSGGPDVATAAAWAFEHGYLRILLTGPPLSERLRSLADAHRPVSGHPRLLLLCPSDGRPPADAERLGQLTSIGHAAPFSREVAGARRRRYGAHNVFLLKDDSGQQRLVAAEAVGSLRTLRVVAEAMAECRRALPPLDADRLVGQFVARLRETVARDARLRAAFSLVEYDPGRPGALEAALTAAAFSEPAEPPAPAPTPSPLPGGVGVYLAWSFVHGYLALTAGRRDVAGELARLAADTGLRLPLSRVVVLCPTAADWGDEPAALDARLRPARDVDGVELAGRRYGDLSIYSADGGACFALELATPLRTLRLGAAGAGLGEALYRREAVRFVEELRTLLEENPDMAAHYTVLRVDKDADIVRELNELAESLEEKC